MSLVFLPNLFFEEELAAQSAGRGDLYPSAAAKRLVAELAPVVALLTDSEEESFLVVDEDAIPDQIPSALSHARFVTHAHWVSSTMPRRSGSKFEAWGWSSQAKRVAALLGFDVSCPDSSAVELVNSRRFLVPLDQVRERGSDCGDNVSTESFSRLCSSLHEVEDGLRELTSNSSPSWVIKSNLSQAARNRIVGRGAMVSDAHRRWLEKQFVADQPVALEPWVERLEECGLQFHIPADARRGDIEFVGAAEMLTDSTGRYLGSWITRQATVETAEWITPAIEYGFEVARQARLNGCFGPIGFDCMKFRDPRNGREMIRLCHDINARFTMGRVALSLRRFLENNETGVWLHADANRWGAIAEERVSGRGDSIQVNASNGSGVRIVPTSPAITGSKPTQLKTALLISSDRTALKAVADRILWHTSSSPSDC